MTVSSLVNKLWWLSTLTAGRATTQDILWDLRRQRHIYSSAIYRRANATIDTGTPVHVNPSMGVHCYFQLEYGLPLSIFNQTGTAEKLVSYLAIRKEGQAVTSWNVGFCFLFFSFLFILRTVAFSENRFLLRVSGCHHPDQIRRSRYDLIARETHWVWHGTEPQWRSTNEVRLWGAPQVFVFTCGLTALLQRGIWMWAWHSEGEEAEYKALDCLYQLVQISGSKGLLACTMGSIILWMMATDGIR